MKQISIFECEYCHTRFNDKEVAEMCENGHKKPVKVKLAKYTPITSDRLGYPMIVKLEMSDGQIIEYKRLSR